MKNKILVLCASLILLSGCASITGNDRKTALPVLPTYGIFKTVNKGDAWQQKGALYTIDGTRKTVAFTGGLFMAFDPQDVNTMYLGTDAGLYYSYSRGEGWFITLQGKGLVNGLAVDPHDKCTLYAAVHDKIYKSTDCARNWDLIHFTSLPAQYFTSILVSRSDSRYVYLGTSDGNLVYSKNAGLSWEVLKYFDTPITTLFQNPVEPEAFYVVTPNFGIQKTTDGGISWASLNELPVHQSNGELKQNDQKQSYKLKDLAGSNTFYDLKPDLSQTDGLIYASSYGIFRLVNGEYWQEVDALSKPTQDRIYSIDVDKNNGQSIYFMTQRAFYRSDNGGKDWTLKNLPSTGIPQFLSLAPDQSQELYMILSPAPKQ